MTTAREFTCAPEDVCERYLALARGDVQLALDLIFVVGWAVSKAPTYPLQRVSPLDLAQLAWKPLDSGRKPHPYFTHRAAARCGYDLNAAKTLLELVDTVGFPAPPTLTEQYAGRGSGWDVAGILREYTAPPSELRRALEVSKQHVSRAHKCLALWGHSRKVDSEVAVRSDYALLMHQSTGAPERICDAALSYCAGDFDRAVALVLEMNDVAGYPLSEAGEELKAAHLLAREAERNRLEAMEAAELERQMIGLHLVSPRAGGLYTHHGIYIGNDEVIHYTGLANGLQAGPVAIASLEDFAAGDDVDIRHYPAMACDGAQTVARARSRLGEASYNVVTNNCEHFCTWCVTGRSESQQVRHVGFSLLTAVATRSMAGMVGWVGATSLPAFAAVLAIQLISGRPR